MKHAVLQSNKVRPVEYSPCDILCRSVLSSKYQHLSNKFLPWVVRWIDNFVRICGIHSILFEILFDYQNEVLDQTLLHFRYYKTHKYAVEKPLNLLCAYLPYDCIFLDLTWKRTSIFTTPVWISRIPLTFSGQCSLKGRLNSKNCQKFNFMCIFMRFLFYKLKSMRDFLKYFKLR